MNDLFSTVSRKALLLGRQNFVSISKNLPKRFTDASERSSCVKPCSQDDYFYNFLDSLTETEAAANGKSVFVEECRRLYANTPSIIRAIDEFDRSYVSERAVYWYTRNGFLFTLVNQALRQRNIEALLLLHFFIRDLDVQLLEATNGTENNDWEKQIDLYRGQLMSLDEIEDIKRRDQKGFFYSFLSTSTSVDVARMFSGEGQIMIHEPVQPVLFHFDCSMLKMSRGVANIQRLSDNDAEEEILFSPLYTFSVRDVQYNEDEHVWKVECGMDGDQCNLSLLLHQRIIKLDIAVRILTSSTSASDDSDGEIHRQFLEGMSTVSNELDIPEANIVTLDENDEVQKSTKHAVTAIFLLKGLKYFDAALLAHKPTISNDTMAALWDCLGTICKDKGEFQRALHYFEKAEAFKIENMSTVAARKVSERAAIRKNFYKNSR